MIWLFWAKFINSWQSCASFNFAYITMGKHCQHDIYSVGVLLAELIPFFDVHLMTAGGYLVCATPHTILHQSIWNFAGSFVMVCRYACVFGIFDNLIFDIFFSNFWGLNTIKVHYRWYLVCATPPTVLYWSILSFAGPFVMVCRCTCGFGILLSL